MEVYNYTKAGVDLDVLSEAIRLRTSVRKEFQGGSMRGDQVADNIELLFNRALLSSEIDEVTAIVNAIGPSYDLVVRKNIEQNTMSWARQTGVRILDQFAANNIYRGKNATQVEALATAYPDIIHSLITGSLQTAYGVFLALQPDENITQEEIDEFALRLKIVLGL